MRTSRKYILIFCIVVIILSSFSGCTEDNITFAPFNENYEYTIKNGFYPRPSFVYVGSRMDTLNAILDDGIYICFTSDESIADDFINSQRTLLRFLRDSGVEVDKFRYYGTDYNDNFSDSSKNSVYISLSSMGTYQQILVTLHALWGDYVDFGYVYALSNAIAEHLEWQTDTFVPIEITSMPSSLKIPPQ